MKGISIKFAMIIALIAVTSSFFSPIVVRGNPSQNYTGFVAGVPIINLSEFSRFPTTNLGVSPWSATYNDAIHFMNFLNTVSPHTATFNGAVYALREQTFTPQTSQVINVERNGVRTGGTTLTQTQVLHEGITYFRIPRPYFFWTQSGTEMQLRIAMIMRTPSGSTLDNIRFWDNFFIVARIPLAEFPEPVYQNVGIGSRPLPSPSPSPTPSPSPSPTPSPTPTPSPSPPPSGNPGHTYFAGIGFYRGVPVFQFPGPEYRVATNPSMLGGAFNGVEKAPTDTRFSDTLALIEFIENNAPQEAVFGGIYHTHTITETANGHVINFYSGGTNTGSITNTSRDRVPNVYYIWVRQGINNFHLRRVIIYRGISGNQNISIYFGEPNLITIQEFPAELEFPPINPAPSPSPSPSPSPPPNGTTYGSAVRPIYIDDFLQIIYESRRRHVPWSDAPFHANAFRELIENDNIVYVERYNFQGNIYWSALNQRHISYSSLFWFENPNNLTSRAEFFTVPGNLQGLAIDAITRIPARRGVLHVVGTYRRGYFDGVFTYDNHNFSSPGGSIGSGDSGLPYVYGRLVSVDRYHIVFDRSLVPGGQGCGNCSCVTPVTNNFNEYITNIFNEYIENHFHDNVVNHFTEYIENHFHEIIENHFHEFIEYHFHEHFITEEHFHEYITKYIENHYHFPPFDGEYGDGGLNTQMLVLIRESIEGLRGDVRNLGSDLLGAMDENTETITDSIDSLGTLIVYTLIDLLLETLDFLEYWLEGFGIMVFLLGILALLTFVIWICVLIWRGIWNHMVQVWV